jgi:hypothetical protein
MWDCVLSVCSWLCYVKTWTPKLGLVRLMAAAWDDEQQIYPWWMLLLFSSSGGIWVEMTKRKQMNSRWHQMQSSGSLMMIQLCGIEATTNCNCKEAMAPCPLKALGSSLTKGNISSRPPTACNCKPDMESTEDLLWTGQWRGGLQVDSDEIVHSYGCWLLQQDYYGAWSSLLVSWKDSNGTD